MKMRKEHFETLRACMLAARKNDTRVDNHLTTLELSNTVSDERIRWDWLHLTKIDGMRSSPWMHRNLYPYLNDDHIDTALRKITGLTR